MVIYIARTQEVSEYLISLLVLAKEIFKKYLYIFYFDTRNLCVVLAVLEVAQKTMVA